MSHDVLVLGTLCEDLFPSFPVEARLEPGALFEIGPLRAQPGGCVANTGFALSDLGTATSLAADVGDDAIAELLVSHVERRGVDGSGIRRVPGLSTSYSVVVEDAQDRCIWHHPGANAQFDGQRVGAMRYGVVHAGYPSLLDALARDDGAALVRLFDQHKASGATTSLDLAVVDDAKDGARVDWIAWLRNVLPHTDVFSPSSDDLRSAGVDGDDPAELARTLVGMGAAVVMVKDSTRGITLATASRQRVENAGRALAEHAAQWSDLLLWTPALQVREKSTAGAGDACVAGLLHGIAQGLGPRLALRCAAAASAARVEHGETVPRWELLRARLDQGWQEREAAPPPGVELVAGEPGRRGATAASAR